MDRYEAVSGGARWALGQLKLFSWYGRSAAREIGLNLGLQPTNRRARLEKSYEEISSFVGHFNKNESLFYDFSQIFMRFRDIRGSVKNLKNGLVLDDTELFEIKGFCLKSQELAKLYLENHISLDTVHLASCESIIKLLNPDEIVVTSFHIHESYSQALQEIRKQKQAVEFKIIRERDEEGKKVLRADRALIIEQEQAEEYKVRVFLSHELKKELAILEHNITAISQLELICAKAQMAIEYKGIRPKIDNSSTIILKQGINPELATYLKEKGKAFTPVDIELKQGCTLLTGANMGGKTVALNTLISNVELALMGFYVFAEQLQIPLLDFVFITGNEANAHGFGLSSFGAEIVKLNELIELNQKGRGLVVCDEFARSTNPYEGKRFVQALTDFFNDNHSFGLLSTHYDGIKNQGLCYRVRGLKKDINNISLKAESIENHMDYRLIPVSDQEAIPKEAINIAKLMNLSTDFLKILEKYYKI